jgi:hypothetical protein
MPNHSPRLEAILSERSNDAFLYGSLELPIPLKLLLPNETSADSYYKHQHLLD